MISAVAKKTENTPSAAIDDGWTKFTSLKALA